MLDIAEVVELKDHERLNCSRETPWKLTLWSVRPQPTVTETGECGCLNFSVTLTCWDASNTSPAQPASSPASTSGTVIAADSCTWQVWTTPSVWGGRWIIAVFSKYCPMDHNKQWLIDWNCYICRLHATKYPDGWDFNGVSCNTDCNTANTCKTDGDDYILVPVASENGRNPEKSWSR